MGTTLRRATRCAAAALTLSTLAGFSTMAARASAPIDPPLTVHISGFSSDSSAIVPGAPIVVGQSVKVEGTQTDADSITVDITNPLGVLVGHQVLVDPPVNWSVTISGPVVGTKITATATDDTDSVSDHLDSVLIVAV